MARRSHFLTLFVALFSIGLVIALVSNPQTSFQAALRGLNIWWEVVFPATLPFIVLSEILMGFGVVHFVGVLLEPLMRPLFNVPGTGGFILTMGFASGYPVTAKLTTSLRESGTITRAEGERLVSFVTTGDPLFVIGAVAVGFFHNEQLGFILAATHYVSALLLGIMYRFHAPRDLATKPISKNKLPLLLRALQAMHRARLNDGRAFGRLMGDAVHSALQTLLMIGGFLIVFSVILQLLGTLNITQFLSAVFTVLLAPFDLPPQFAKALISGLFEVTLGAQATSEVPGQVSLMWKAAIASAVLSWGGLSVHAQVASILSSTDIRVAPYLLARFIHAILAAIMTLIFWGPLTRMTEGIAASKPVFQVYDQPRMLHAWSDSLSHNGLTATLIFIVLIIISLLLYRQVSRPTR
ncbi:sporulation integral membrane protein YlbJ [Brevibacillus fluminis]|uniref:sporulation integral membrane protein YlbJ n=1 Tax=Brevibacillus fluminis TaxID=511487 RepID=UPI003F8B7F0C